MYASGELEILEKVTDNKLKVTKDHIHFQFYSIQMLKR